jgi:hypothetical protein
MHPKVYRLVISIIGAYAFFLIGFGIAYFIQYFSESNLNDYVAQTSTEYMYALIWSLIIGTSIYFWKVPPEHKKYLFVLWFARCAVVLTAMIYYEKKYLLDAFLYYKDGLASNYNYSPFGFEGSQSVVALVNVLVENVPLMNSFHSLKIFWSLIGLISIYITYKAYVLHYGENKKVLMTLGFFPSILFWSSTLGKDSLILLGISLSIYGCLKIIKEFTLKNLLLVAVGIFIILQIRFWISILVVFAAMFSFIMTSKKVKNRMLPFLVSCVAFYFSYGFFVEKLKIFTLTEFLDKTNTVSRGWAMGGSGAASVPEFNSVIDIIKFVPLGVFTALFRPLPGEINNIFGFFSGLENIVLLYVIARVCYLSNIKKNLNSAAVYLLVFVVSWTLLYCTVSYQNLGTAVRFKLQILPALVILIFALAHKEKKTEDLTLDPITDDSGGN